MLEALKSGASAAPSTQFLDVLQKNHYLFASPGEEEAIFEGICQDSWTGFHRDVSQHFTFILNSHCNFNCPYCFEQEAFRAFANTLSPAQIDAAFRVVDTFMREGSPAGAAEFEIFGGEPLLPASRSNLVYLIGRIEERGASTSLQSNGYYLASSLDILRMHQATVQQLQLTLDGPPEIHNKRRVPRSGEPTFDRIVEGIDRLLSENLPININLRMNVDRTNVDALESMAKYYDDKGWTRHSTMTFVAAPVDNRSSSLNNPELLLGWHELFERVLPLSIDSGGGPFDLSIFKATNYFRYYFNTLSQQGHKKPVFTPKVLFCEAAALKLFVFHPDGRIYPCPESVGMNELAIGKYYPEWKMDEANMELWRAQTILSRPQCRECEISTFCGGGCVLNALLKNGSMAHPECENAQELLSAYFDKISQAIS
jgi:uncharacterized protein